MNTARADIPESSGGKVDDWGGGPDTSARQNHALLRILGYPWAYVQVEPALRDEFWPAVAAQRGMPLGARHHSCITFVYLVIIPTQGYAHYVS